MMGLQDDLGVSENRVTQGLNCLREDLQFHTFSKGVVWQTSATAVSLRAKSRKNSDLLQQTVPQGQVLDATSRSLKF